MNIIKDIINDLIDSQKSISSPLLKTKVLATKLKNAELLEWVDNELSGYHNTDSLPKYRVVHALLKGVFRNGFQQYNNVPLVSRMLPNKLSIDMNKAHLMMGVASLESYLNKDLTGVLEEPLSAETCNLIAKGYRNMGNIDFEVINAYKEFPLNAVVQALSEIRSKLLELMLLIDEDFGNTEIDELINKKSIINELINPNMYNLIISGNGNILTQGDKNKIYSKITNLKGKTDEVVTLLKEHGVKEDDISEIIEIFTNESPDYENKTPGKRATEWMKKMLGKSLDGSWDIAVGAAGDLLSNLISNFYGL
jgi:hypothetical protein